MPGKNVKTVDGRLARNSALLSALIFFAAVFSFFAFFYNKHLHFEEETQLFLTTGDFFTAKMKLPGGLSGYLGGFLTQFYHLDLAGPFIIAVLLLGIQQLTLRILNRVNVNPAWFLLSFLPAVNGMLILCDEFYPLSGIVGILAALFAGWIYTGTDNRTKRFISGLLLIAVTYWIAGGSFLMLVGIILACEALIFFKARRRLKTRKDNQSSTLKGWQLTVLVVVAAAIPLLVRQFLVLQPLGLAYITEFYYDMRTVIPTAIPVILALPAILMALVYFLPENKVMHGSVIFAQAGILVILWYFGLKLWANFSAEQIMTYDQLVRNEKWKEVLDYAEKEPPRNNLSLAMLNLALAKTNRMGDQLFRYEQNGFNGLFLPFAKEYVAPMMGSEILFQLGLINASQEYSFESTETTPNLDKSVRAIKRLAETNLINGQYEVAGKYLKILQKTVFYRKWAGETMKLLYNEDLINSHPVYGAKRKLAPKRDFFFKIQNMEEILKLMIRENPSNNMAFQYLMSFYLLNKDLRNFMNSLPMMNTMKYIRIPVAYEEAIMYVIGLATTNPMANTDFRISNETKARMQAYADIYTTRRDAQQILGTRFGNTFWYYLHYKQIEITPAEVQREYH
ncbi:MAG: DUF6057 family protein [Bacteroidales bacterium]|jgi:hypothetical protein|nr:DUF6057 family protein [Bacteroidales bacterium]